MKRLATRQQQFPPKALGFVITGTLEGESALDSQLVLKSQSTAEMHGCNGWARAGASRMASDRADGDSRASSIAGPRLKRSISP